MESDQFLNFLKEPVFTKLTYVFVVAPVIWLSFRLSKSRLRKYVSDSTTRHRARKFITAISYVLVAFVAMVIFDYRLSGVTLALGLAGTGMAFAFQEVRVRIAGTALDVTLINTNR